MEYIIQDSTLQDIADAIRSKTGNTAPIQTDAFANAISLIETGGGGGGGGEDTVTASLRAYCEGTGDIIVLPKELTKIKDNCFRGWSELVATSLPDSITAIGKYAFNQCSKLALTSLPVQLTIIDNYAFYFCPVTFTSIPKGVTRIGSCAFRNCKGLTNLTFKGTPTYIHNDVFNGCDNLTIINVPWAEGEVANAPWGATQATINYNYTGA